MSEAAITHFLAQYGPLAVFSFAALRIGAILGRRFVRKDRPRWYPHLPPLPATQPNPITFLLDVAAWVVMAYLGLGVIVRITEGQVDGDTAILGIWLLVFGGLGHYWVAYDHNEAVHQYRYRTDPAYRVESDLAEEEEERRRESWSEESNGMMGFGPYAILYNSDNDHH